MLKQLSAVLTATLISAASLQAQEVQQVTIGENLTYGITYSLPTTAIIISVESTCAKTEAGPFAAYAEKFLGVRDAVQTDQSLWEIQNITMQSVAMADSARTYHIEFPEKGLLPTFYLTNDRCLCSINREPQELAALPEEKVIDLTGKAPYKASDVLTGEILKAGSKLKQAELVAQEIFSIRESRSLLIKGEADNMPGDGASLQLMLDNLSAQEEALMTLFVGTTTKTQQTRNYTYIPKEETTRDLAFRFSKHLGYVDIDDYAGEPYYVSIQMTEDNREQIIPGAKTKKRSENGIAFCIPGKAHITLLDTKKTLTEGDIYLSQFGRVEQLPQGQFTDKKRPCSAAFTPATGAIKIFEQQQQ